MCYAGWGCGRWGLREPLRGWRGCPGFYRWSPDSKPYGYKRWLEEYAQELKEELSWVEEEMKEQKLVDVK